MSDERLVYTPRLDTTPETEAATLAAVYRFVLDCYAKKKGGVPSTADDAKETTDDRVRESIQE